MIIFGHRGAGGYEPANTLRSFRKALACKVDYIEMDVWVCRSGEVVVFHDAKLDLITDGTGFVADKTLAELKKLDHGKGETIPTLQEALDVINRKTKVNIEIKGDGNAERVHAVIDEYVRKKSWQYSDFLVSSFNHYELVAFRSYNPHIPLGAVVAGIPLGYAEFAVQINAFSVHLSKEFITQNFVDDAHKRKLDVYVYTINDTEFLEKVAAMNVDGIFTDYPDTIRMPEKAV